MRVFLILLMLSGCALHVEEPHAPCGYDETPYYEIPSACDAHCCVWHMDDIYFYSECAEVWCYDEHVCGWQLFEHFCYPV